MLRPWCWGPEERAACLWVRLLVLPGGNSEPQTEPTELSGPLCPTWALPQLVLLVLCWEVLRCVVVPTTYWAWRTRAQDPKWAPS